MRKPPPIVWTIAGSDSSGGAGIQADLLTMNRLGVHGCSVVTALTAQSTVGVTRVEAVSPDLLQGQLDAMRDDLPPAAIKIGMLATAELVTTVADLLPTLSAFVVCDPVLAATSSGQLLEADALPCLTQRLLPQCDLITPNLPEARALVGSEDPAALRALGPGAVLLKGGHADGPEARDLLCSDEGSWWISSPRIEPRGSHGTGCTLSSAIASLVARGESLLEAVTHAKAYVNQALRLAPGLGRGNGPLHFGPYPPPESDIPNVSKM